MLRRVTLQDDPQLDWRDLWPYSPWPLYLWAVTICAERCGDLN